MAEAEEAETATNGGIELGEQRYVELSAAEQFVLTLSERGFGKRSSPTSTAPPAAAAKASWPCR